jgi:hypothetical protein
MIIHITKENRPFAMAKIESLDKSLDWTVKVTEYNKRTAEQNAKLHAMLTDIANQSKHLNQNLSADDWKRLCVAQFRQDCIANNVDKLADYWRKHDVRFMPGLDGKSLVALGKPTHEFPIYVMAGFIDWLIYWGAENNIKFTAPKEFY